MSIASDNAKTFNSIREERAFEAKAEKMLKGYREFPNGRDFRCFKERDRSDFNNSEFDKAYDATFPGAPGSPEWLDRRFGKKINTVEFGQYQGLHMYVNGDRDENE